MQDPELHRPSGILRAELATSEERRARAEEELYVLRQRYLQEQKDHERTLALLRQQREFAEQRVSEGSAREQVLDDIFYITESTMTVGLFFSSMIC